MRGAQQQSLVLDRVGERLKQLSERQLSRNLDQVDNAAHSLRLLDPQRVLERGFAILRSHGKVVRSAGAVPLNQPLTLTLADGNIRVERTEE